MTKLDEIKALGPVGMARRFGLGKPASKPGVHEIRNIVPTINVPAPDFVRPSAVPEKPKRKRGRPVKADAVRRDMAAYKRAWRAKQKKP